MPQSRQTLLRHFYFFLHILLPLCPGPEASTARCVHDPYVSSALRPGREHWTLRSGPGHWTLRIVDTGHIGPWTLRVGLLLSSLLIVGRWFVQHAAEHPGGFVVQFLHIDNGQLSCESTKNQNGCYVALVFSCYVLIRNFNLPLSVHSFFSP